MRGKRLDRYSDKLHERVEAFENKHGLYPELLAAACEFPVTHKVDQAKRRLRGFETLVAQWSTAIRAEEYLLKQLKCKHYKR